MGKGMIVAADVGGTKTDLGLFDVKDPLSPVRSARYASADHAGLEDVLADFLGDTAVAAIGVAAAGPVIGDAVRTTNLPWFITVSGLQARLGDVPVRLLNDLGAAAAGVLELGDSSFDFLNPGVAAAGKNRAVLAPGTGLGQSILFWTGERYLPSATEGGHVGFAPRGEEQIELLRFVARRHASVSYERLVSGLGLPDLFAFVSEELAVPIDPSVAERVRGGDAGAVIGEAAVAGTCKACAKTVELFLSILAARAGDLVLSVMATGGLYIGGGIVPKLLPILDRARFRDDFVGRGPFADLLAEVPVRLVLEPRVNLLGASVAAAHSLAADT